MSDGGRLYGVEIVHAGAAKGAVGHGEAGRLDDMRLETQARAQAQNRSGVLRDIGLVKGDAHACHSAAEGRKSTLRGALVGTLALSRQGCQ
jgi:hypothetical protein